MIFGVLRLKVKNTNPGGGLISAPCTCVCSIVLINLVTPNHHANIIFHEDFLSHQTEMSMTKKFIFVHCL